jgi:excisionase family DNA binding protein
MSRSYSLFPALDAFSGRLTKLLPEATVTAVGKMISAAEAAERLGVSVKRVHQLCRGRRIPHARLHGRTWLIPEAFKVTPGTRGPAMGSK